MINAAYRMELCRVHVQARRAHERCSHVTPRRPLREGTQSLLQDLLAAEADLFDETMPRDVDEVVNYVRAMKHGLARPAELPVSVRLIREIHAELIRGVCGVRLQPGELRRSQNWIGPPGCTLNTASFVPLPHEDVPQVLSDWNASCTRTADGRRW